MNWIQRNPFGTAVKAAYETHFPGSISTVRQHIREFGLKNYSASKKFALEPQHKQDRLNFANLYVNENADFWERVIFSDEKIFQSSHDGPVRVYRPANTRYEERYIKPTHRSEWLVQRIVNKVALVITNVKTLEVMERWDFNVQYEGNIHQGNDQVSDKPLKQIRNEIRDVMKQIASSVAYLPLLDCLCSFDIQIYTKSDVVLPNEWADAEPANVKNAQSVKMRSFSTNIHKMETVVTYKNDD
ncbi:mitotic spindle assembly checkpoint protein mad2 [Holotrichia oblita]|uniref:Mitotic spindle assembly checkpoint protein mad2 n=1 Tax=Holotrichia oblita TaxID=644536 RepID=A0ACB9TF53_HOLOL|nr:mitotic spindle assembly checkpoint protein mad2 [Holotrichia oblita]